MVHDPVRELDDVVVPPGLRVQLREGEGGERRRFDLLHHVDRLSELTVGLMQLRERKSDGRAVEPQLGDRAGDDLESEPE